MGVSIVGNVTVTGDIVGGDKITITIQQLVQGYGELSTRYDGRVQNSLEHYLGRPGHPLPFSGSADSFYTLDEWLADNNSPHCALLAAPAGRGKSALLAQWVTQIVVHGTDHIIYFPVSIRFNTNLEGVAFAALAARARASLWRESRSDRRCATISRPVQRPFALPRARW